MGTAPGSTEQVAQVPVMDQLFISDKRKKRIRLILLNVEYKTILYSSFHQRLDKLLSSDDTSCFSEEVMLAEENKNPGPSALDGKLTENFFFFNWSS